MPTLSEKNKIVPAKWMIPSMKRKIEETRGIDFLLDYIEERIWLSKDMPPKIKIKGPGSKVLVLRSGTGSGKSTMIPPALYARFFDKINRNIIITQPTIATATDIPYQIIQYTDLKLGQNLGFQTGTIARKPVKGILFSTTGILLQFLKTLTDEQFMRKYSFIIIDEVHNRAMDTDSTLYYVKQLLKRNYETADCPFVILMSGTFDPKPFMDYFQCPKENFLDVLGSSFPIEDHFTKYDLSNYLEYAVDLVERLHIENIDDVVSDAKIRDILVFIQGNVQIKMLSDKIHYLNTKVFSRGLEYARKHNEEQQAKYKKIGGRASAPPDAYYLAPIGLMSRNIQKGGREYKDLYSDISSVSVEIYEFDAEGNRTDKILDVVYASRRVMLGTNSIETGLTIDTLKYCIDTGYVKESMFYPNLNCQILIDKNVSQASSRQRRGRVGRKAPGQFYACYTADVYRDMQPLPAPDIVKEDISLFLLNIILSETKTTLEISDYSDEAFQMSKYDQNWYSLKTEMPFYASKLDFIQSPSADSLGYSIEKLATLGFIDHEYKPTIIGLYGAKFRKLSIENIRMILAGYQHGANVLDLITIACCIEIGFEIGIQRRKYVPRNPLGVSADESIFYNKILFADEFIEYLFIWYDFMQAIEKVGAVLEKNSIAGAKKAIPINYVPGWCEENGFKLDGLMRVVELRDEILGDMLTMGINPYYNGLDLPRGTYNLVSILRRNLTDGMQEIIKIKHCIYEGYRLNVCIWDIHRKAYISGNHIALSLDSKLTKAMTPDADLKQTRPQKIIVSGITLMESFFDKGNYDFVGGEVSVLDGFVDVDIDFVSH